MFPTEDAAGVGLLFWACSCWYAGDDTVGGNVLTACWPVVVSLAFSRISLFFSSTMRRVATAALVACAVDWETNVGVDILELRLLAGKRSCCWQTRPLCRAATRGGRC